MQNEATDCENSQFPSSQQHSDIVQSFDHTRHCSDSCSYVDIQLHTYQEDKLQQKPTITLLDVDVRRRRIRGKLAQACSLFTRLFNTPKLV